MIFTKPKKFLSIIFSLVFLKNNLCIVFLRRRNNKKKPTTIKTTEEIFFSTIFVFFLTQKSSTSNFPWIRGTTPPRNCYFVSKFKKTKKAHVLFLFVLFVKSHNNNNPQPVYSFFFCCKQFFWGWSESKS